MPLTRVTPNIIAVANNVTNRTVGNTTSIPSFTFDGAGVVTSASNVAISGAGITANTVANSAIQTGAVENYLRGANLDFGMRNRIINGAMVIDQRNAGAAVTPTDGTYTLDRWQSYQTPASKFTVQRDSSANTVAGFTSSLKVTSSSAYSVTSNDYFTVSQPIEGFNVADLGWGTANARPITISFWVRSSLTGTFGAGVTNSAFNRSYPFSYTINSANTWEYETITIPGDTSGTWLTNNGRGIELDFGIGIGSTNSGTAGSWQSGWKPSVTGAVSVVGTNGATWYVTGVQLEEGSVPTPFEYRQYGTELQLCQRYCWVMSGNGLYYPRQHVDAISTTTGIWYVQYPVAFRALPSLTTKNVSSSTIEMSNHVNGAAPSLSSVTFGESAFESGFVNMNAASGFTAGSNGHWRWIGGPDANFTFSAEL